MQKLTSRHLVIADALISVVGEVQERDTTSCTEPQVPSGDGGSAFPAAVHRRQSKVHCCFWFAVCLLQTRPMSAAIVVRVVFAHDAPCQASFCLASIFKAFLACTEALHL